MRGNWLGCRREYKHAMRVRLASILGWSSKESRVIGWIFVAIAQGDFCCVLFSQLKRKGSLLCFLNVGVSQEDGRP